MRLLIMLILFSIVMSVCSIDLCVMLVIGTNQKAKSGLFKNISTRLKAVNGSLRLRTVLRDWNCTLKELVETDTWKSLKVSPHMMAIQDIGTIAGKRVLPPHNVLCTTNRKENVLSARVPSMQGKLSKSTILSLRKMGDQTLLIIFD